MSEGAPLDEATMKFGLLMESAQAHQQLAEAQLARLQAHTQDLDEIVRDEIRATLIRELQAVSTESARATQALRGLQRSHSFRRALWSVIMTTLCAAVPMAIARWVLPSASDLAVLETRRQQLALSVQRLEQRGGLIELRRCGEHERICVRIDHKAAAYGEKSDYFVVAGY
jgi:hypothetical protein